MRQVLGFFAASTVSTVLVSQATGQAIIIKKNGRAGLSEAEPSVKQSGEIFVCRFWAKVGTRCLGAWISACLSHCLSSKDFVSSRKLLRCLTGSH